MYRIKKQNQTIEVAQVTYIKKLPNETIITCDSAEAMGIVKEDGAGFYQLKGREYLGDFETVTIEEIQPDQEVIKAQIVALTESREFLEEVIAEMAMMIYQNDY